MTSQIRTIQEHSAEFVPAFVLIEAESGRDLFENSTLDMRFLGGSPLGLSGRGASPRVTPPDEQEFGRWVIGGGCLILVSEDGTPVPQVGGERTGSMTRLYGGYAEVVLTNRRILAAVLDAETIFGRLTRDGNAGVLLFTLDLDEVQNVTAEMSRGLLGSTKEKKVTVQNVLSTSSFILSFEEFVSGGRVFDKLVDAVARRRQEGPIGQELGATSPADVMLREGSGQRVSVTFPT